MWIRWTGSKLLQKMWFVGQNLADCGLLTARGHLGFWEKRTKIPFWDFWNFFEKSLQAMYQGSHLPNFEALSVPKKKPSEDRQTDDTASSHSEGFLRNLHKNIDFHRRYGAFSDVQHSLRNYLSIAWKSIFRMIEKIVKNVVTC